MAVLFPLWQIERKEYDEVCSYLGLSPSAALYDRLIGYLASAPFRFASPQGFARFLAELPLTRFRVARLDLLTKLLSPAHPVRHALNAVMALHECDADGYRQIAGATSRRPVGLSLLGWGLGFLFRLTLTLPWLGWQLMRYVPQMPFRRNESLVGRRVLVTGVGRGLGMDIMLECLERGARVVGTVRDRESVASVMARLPAQAPVVLLSADLGTPGTLVQALRAAQVEPESVDIAILCAGVKHDGESVLVLPSLRHTFEVNCFAAAEFAAWFCPAPDASVHTAAVVPDAEPGLDPASPSSPRRLASNDQRRSGRSLVLISSIGRWHGMHGSCGYNASKAALSIWGESLDMELRLHQPKERKFTVTIVEPGMFESDMAPRTALTKLLLVSRRGVAANIISSTLAGKKSIRPPFWFALLTWAVCLAGRDVRYRLFAGVKAGGKPK
jgi:NAD(P)-dependent dehydrogenase (short-subunit alcohol dehydrogenase family)